MCKGLRDPWPLDGDTTSQSPPQHETKTGAKVDVKKQSAMQPVGESCEMKPAACAGRSAATDDDNDDDDDDDDDDDIDDIMTETHDNKADTSDARELQDDNGDDSDSFSDLYPGYFARSSLEITET